jgi:NADH:ubiquinone oxidoreductase subunit B-like Fe-S oxidoreductase
MAPALLEAWYSIAEPRLVIVVGVCAISDGLFAESPQIDRSGLVILLIDLYIPGCPPYPLTFINALLDFLERK